MQKTSSVFMTVLMLAAFSMFFLCSPSESPAPGLCYLVDCDDGDACTSEYCDTATGLCVYEGPPDCNDDDPCTDDSCDPSTGLCVNVDNGTCEECAPADPKTQGYWKRQCMALLDIPKPGLLKLMEPGPWMGWEGDCAILLPKAKGDMCAKADKQITALELNYMTDRVDDCNCLLGGGTVGEAWSQLIGSDLDCTEKNDLAEGINSGDLLISGPCFVD